MGAALAWGALAASSLFLGALIGLVRPWPARAVGVVLGFGAGALISAVSFDLAQEGARLGSAASVGAGLAAGALTYYGLDRLLESRGRRGKVPVPADANTGTGLALGAFLDGIPEQMVLGIGLATGAGVSVSLLVAIFMSNLPEAIGAATAMRHGGHRLVAITRLWLLVALVCTCATVVGFGVADAASAELEAAINGFAAGALLVMLIDSMIPAAASDAGRSAGLVTALGFAVAAAISGVA